MTVCSDFDRLFESLTKRQWSTHLKKVGDVEALKRKIDKDLSEGGMRRGMVYFMDYSPKSKEHPYPTFTLHLADKSVMPFRLIHIQYNEAVTRFNLTETRDRSN